MNIFKNKNKRKVLLMVLSLIGLIAITVGVTYAFYSYAKEGTTENTITSGTITFHYDELKSKGRGITLTDAFPVADNDDAKESNDYFDFRITSKTSSLPVSYVVTARMNDGSDSILGNITDMYLTEVSGSSETPTELFTGSLPKYNSLTQYTAITNHTEKVIFESTVPAGSTNYDKTFRLRMWIDDSADFSAVNVTKYYCDGTEVNETDYNSCVGEKTTNTTMEYPYNDKSFSVTVNVYANGELTNNPIIASNVGYTTTNNANVASVADALDDLRSLLK